MALIPNAESPAYQITCEACGATIPYIPTENIPEYQGFAGVIRIIHCPVCDEGHIIGDIDD